MSNILGVDLGVSRTRIAIYDESGPRSIPLDEKSGIQSTIRYEHGELLVGEPKTKGQAASRPSSVHLLDILSQDNVVLNGETIATEDIATAFFEHVLRGARESRPEIDGLVIAGRYFTQAERQRLTTAVESAGSTLHRFVQETEAVTMYHGEKTDTDADRTVLTLALGASSARASITDAGGGVYEVVAHAADPGLGGREWDRRLCQSLALSDKLSHITDESQLRQKVQTAREALDEQSTVSISGSPDDAPSSTVELTHETVRSSLDPIFDGISQLVEHTLEKAGYTHTDIDSIIVAGRLARSPFLKPMLRDIVADPSETTIVAAGADATALGAGVQAGILSGRVDAVVLLDIAPDIRVQTIDGPKTVLGDGVTIPTAGHRVVTTTVDGQTVVPLEISSNSFGYEQETRYSVFVDGLPEAPAGTTHLRITVERDENYREEITVGVVDHQRRDSGSLCTDDMVSFVSTPTQSVEITEQTGLSVVPRTDGDHDDIPPVADATVASVGLGVVDAGDDGRQFTECIRAGDPLPHQESVSVTPPRTTSGNVELPVFAAWSTGRGSDDVDTAVFTKLDLAPLVGDGVRRQVDVKMHAADDGDVSLRVTTNRGKSVSTTLSDVATIDPEQWQE